MAKSKVMFKAALAFRLGEGWHMSADELNEKLSKFQFQPCTSQQETSKGFTQPRGLPHEPLVHAVGGQYLITVQEQKRLLPGAVVKDALAERVREVTDQQGHAPGRKQMKELKEAVRMELLPKAFLSNSTTRVWLNPTDGWLVIEASVGAKSDHVLELLGKALDEFPVRRWSTELAPGAAMTDWLSAGEAPLNFTIDRDCELKSPAEEKAAVRYVRHSLDGQDVRDHLRQGKRPTRLALTYKDRVSFELTERQELKKLVVLDIGDDVGQDADNAEDMFNAEFALMTGEYTNLLYAITEALGGEQKD
ncbi:recombination associated protein RdgC [Novimethylophilus kurashikiensis]|uniref:Recombination-associated protein RdgC n=1 Tax=Novimethylophilus kurashikiensis TaxID=1825523 RepID=A0A2R5F9M9_9PROT|nr:recombination-associated protein RdgC [Novimethylophilus kurashikiensis]GBG14248.1 recombination associated protein RdgC [Novimethylophilus kurashikiensis]